MSNPIDPSAIAKLIEALGAMTKSFSHSVAVESSSASKLATALTGKQGRDTIAGMSDLGTAASDALGGRMDAVAAIARNSYLSPQSRKEVGKSYKSAELARRVAGQWGRRSGQANREATKLAGVATQAEAQAVQAGIKASQLASDAQLAADEAKQRADDAIRPRLLANQLKGDVAWAKQRMEARRRKMEARRRFGFKDADKAYFKSRRVYRSYVEKSRQANTVAAQFGRVAKQAATVAARAAKAAGAQSSLAAKAARALMGRRTAAQDAARRAKAVSARKRTAGGQARAARAKAKATAAKAARTATKATVNRMARAGIGAVARGQFGAAAARFGVGALAAGGSMAGAGLAAAAVVTGGAAATVGLGGFVLATLKAGRELRSFAEQAHAANRNLFSYSARYAGASAHLALADFQRHRTFAAETEHTAITLLHEINTLRQSWLHSDIAGRNIGNRIATEVSPLARMAGTASSVGGQGIDQFLESKGFGERGGKEGAIGRFMKTMEERWDEMWQKMAEEINVKGPKDWKAAAQANGPAEDFALFMANQRQLPHARRVPPRVFPDHPLVNP